MYVVAHPKKKKKKKKEKKKKKKSQLIHFNIHTCVV